MIGKKTQKQKVLDWLLIHGELTTRTAVIELNIMCLPKRISELRNDGYIITIEYRTARSGSRYGVYTLQGVANG